MFKAQGDIRIYLWEETISTARWKRRSRRKNGGNSGGGVDLDPNQTAFVFVNPILNATLYQPPQPILSNPAVTTLVGIVIGWLLNFTTSAIQEKRRYKMDKLQKKEQVYSQLTGFKIMLDQLYLSVHDASVLFDWGCARERLELPALAKLGKLEEKHMQYNELILELARINQKLWETIGLIRQLFSPTDKLDELIKPLEDSIIKIRNYRESISTYYEEATAKNVDIIPDAATTGVETTIREYIDVPFENLLKYLGEELTTEKRDLEIRWWQFWK